MLTLPDKLVDGFRKEVQQVSSIQGQQRQLFLDDRKSDLKLAKENLARAYVSPGEGRFSISHIVMTLCALGEVSTQDVGNSAATNQSTQQQSQQAQQQAQQAQEAARVAQTRADQARQGQRRRHEPENEASQCIQPDFGGLYGGMKNTCDFKVWYTYCGFRPKESSWLTGMNCEKQSFGSDSVGPGRTSASHTKGVESIHWIACKEPAWTVDTEFIPGQGIKGRCHTVGGK